VLVADELPLSKVNIHRPASSRGEAEASPELAELQAHCFPILTLATCFVTSSSFALAFSFT
jgi:hypothetical protein